MKDLLNQYNLNEKDEYDREADKAIGNLRKPKADYNDFIKKISKMKPEEISKNRPSLLKVARSILLVILPGAAVGILTLGVGVIWISPLMKAMKRYEDETNFAEMEKAYNDYIAEIRSVNKLMAKEKDINKYKALEMYKTELMEEAHRIAVWLDSAMDDQIERQMDAKREAELKKLGTVARIKVAMSENIIRLTDPTVVANSSNVITNGKYSAISESVISRSDVNFVNNDTSVFSMSDALTLKRECTMDATNELDLVYNIAELAKEYMLTIKESTKGRLNPIIQSTRNFIMSNTLVANEGMSQCFNGIKIYENVISGVQVDTIVLSDKIPGTGVTLSAAYTGSDQAMIYKITESAPLPYFAIVRNEPHFEVIRLDNTNETMAEAVAVSILENLVGKEYPKYELLDEASIRDVARNVKNKVVQADKAVSSKIDNTVDSIKASAKKLLMPDAKEDLIKDTMPPLSKLIKQAVAVGAAWAINPVLGAITAVVAVALSRKVKRNARRQLLAELREELELVEEKIKDAESKGDNKNKYQLMRLRNKLKTSIEKIKYGDNFVDGRDSVD